MGNDEPLRIPVKDAIGESLVVLCAVKDKSAINFPNGSAAIRSLIDNCLKK